MGKQFKKVIAIYKPKRLDTLRPEYVKNIGKEFKFQYSWIQEKGDSYEGQWVLTNHSGDFIKWVPECDLEMIKRLD